MNYLRTVLVITLFLHLEAVLGQPVKKTVHRTDIDWDNVVEIVDSVPDKTRLHNVLESHIWYQFKAIGVDLGSICMRSMSGFLFKLDRDGKITHFEADKNMLSSLRVSIYQSIKVLEEGGFFKQQLTKRYLLPEKPIVMIISYSFTSRKCESVFDDYQQGFRSLLIFINKIEKSKGGYIICNSLALDSGRKRGSTFE
jgi:hypothetical protein